MSITDEHTRELERMWESTSPNHGITDELRKYATVSWNPWPEARDRLFQMCDRIDAEHEQMMSDKYLNGVMDGREEAAMEWDYTHVRLPVDADGVPIRVGDVLSIYGEKRVCCEMRLKFGSWEVWTPISRHLPDEHGELHHYRPPTVEDVLREMHEKLDEVTALYVGESIDSDERDRDEARIFAEYASKLRLAGEEG